MHFIDFHFLEASCNIYFWLISKSKTKVETILKVKTQNDKLH